MINLPRLVLGVSKIKQLFSLGAYKPLLYNRRKLDVKAENFRFIGYNKSCKDYQFYNEHTNKATIRQDVVFDDTSLLQTGVSWGMYERLKVVTAPKIDWASHSVVISPASV